MTFLYPDMLWWLLLLIPLTLLFIISHGRGQAQLTQLAGEWRARRIVGIYIIKSFFSSLFLILTVFCILLALAGPTWGSRPVEENKGGLEIGLVVDISQSMMATDLSPHRLSRALDHMRILLDRFRTARFSLTVFKGQSLLLVPSTLDHEPLQQILDSLSPDFMTTAGTDIRAGLERAMDSVSSDPSRYKALILFTDGEQNGGDSPKGLTLRPNMPIFFVGMGTTQGASVPDKLGGVQKDDRGEPKVSRLNPEWMIDVAQRSGGLFLMGDEPQAITTLIQQLAQTGPVALQNGVKLEPILRYKDFLLLALLLFLLSLGLKVIKWKNLY